MQKHTINDIQKKYDLELDKVLKNIKKGRKKNKLILLQFADGLKPYATTIVDYLKDKIEKSKSKKNIQFLIWMGTCFGACDTPVGLEKIKPKIDLVIQFGHNEMMPKY